VVHGVINKFVLPACRYVDMHKYTHRKTGTRVEYLS